MKYAYLFIFLIALSCSTKKETTTKKPTTPPVQTQNPIIKPTKPEPPKEVKKEELIVVLSNPSDVNTAKALITNSGLNWERLIFDQETLKIALIKVPADKKVFWMKRLTQAGEFKSVEENKQMTINNIVEKKNNSLFKLEKTPCFGNCPVYEVAIDKNGKVTFNGKQYVSKEGLTEFQLTNDQFNTLKDKLAKNDFNSYEKVYDNPRITDLPSTFITYNNKQIKVRIWKDVPNNLIDVTEFLDEILLAKKLYK